MINLKVNVKVTQPCLTLCNPMDYTVYSPWNSPGQNTGVGSLSLLQGIFPTQGSNPGLPHCRQILYQLSHQGSPRILEWVACPISRGSSWPRNLSRVLCPKNSPGKNTGAWRSHREVHGGCEESDTTERLTFHFHTLPGTVLNALHVFICLILITTI